MAAEQTLQTELQPPLIVEEHESIQEPPLASVKTPTTEIIVEEILNEPVTVAAALFLPRETGSPTKTQETDNKNNNNNKNKKMAPASYLSFREESKLVADLKHFNIERKALEDFKKLVQEAINTRLFVGPESSESVQEVSIWGIPLLKDDRSDVVLLKFLRARDFKVKNSFTMLKNTIKWRKEFGVEASLEEDFGDDLEKVAFNHGHDKEGRPISYYVYGEFQNKELYLKTFGDEENRLRFLRWRIHLLEKSIRNLDFSPGGVASMFHVTDFKTSPGLWKKGLMIAARQVLQVLQDYYPEFVAKQVFINVPFWHVHFCPLITRLLTPRTRRQLVFAIPATTAETLFMYITPEQVPTQYGGLSFDFCECNPEFTVDDPATEIIVEPITKLNLEIILMEKCTLVWELRVVGSEVSYTAVFVPYDDHAYTLSIQKETKMVPTNELVSSRFEVTELGKILLTIDNFTTKGKKLLYRFKVILTRNQ